MDLPNLLPVILISTVTVLSIVTGTLQYLRRISTFRIQNGVLVRKFIDIFEADNIDKIENLDDDFLRIQKGKRDNSKNYLKVSSDLLRYSFVLNPIRLSIMRILYDENDFISSELRKTVNVGWSQYTPHLVALEKKDIIEAEDQFVDDKPRKIVYLTQNGRTMYNEIKEILFTLIAD